MVEAIAGYILAGGKNRRMNGQKKLFLPYGNSDFFHSIKNSLRIFPAVYLSVAEEEKEYKESGLPLIVDQYSGIGPLGGILSGLLSCKEEAVFAVSCDTPEIEEDLMIAMAELYGQSGQPVIIKHAGNYYPIPGIYTKRQIPMMEDMIMRQEYKLRNLFWREEEGTEFQVYRPVKMPKALVNINTMQDYERWKEKEER